jgi:cell cycle arrest protein BUB3
MAVHGDKIVIGCSGRQVLVYDARDLSRPVQVRESSLKYQTRCIKLMPDGTGMLYNRIVLYNMLNAGCIVHSDDISVV